MDKYVRVMDGLKSNACGFEYKLDEINIAKTWNPKEVEPEKMGGFNFGTEDKILRWLHRGDTIYDVLIPEDAKVICCDNEKGIYSSNKIIVTNPRTITDDMVIELYKKTTLSDKIIAQCLVTLLWKNRKEISKFIIKDRVNLDNIELILKEFERYAGEDNLNSEAGKEIHDILKEKGGIMEYLNLYDRNGNLLKEKCIRGVKTDNLVGIVIIFIENSKGEFLIQKTSLEKDSLFATTGGHVTYGLTFKDAIIKEVEEELGIDISNDNIIEVNTYIREFYIQKVYYLKKDISLKDITIQESEVEYVKWLNKEEINNLIDENKFRESNVEGFRYIINKIET